MRYRYDIDDATCPLNTLRGYLDTLGVRLDASIIWNAIPFSFIVDWFCNVSEFLSSRSVDNLLAIVHMDAFAHSVKGSLTVNAEGFSARVTFYERRLVKEPKIEFDPQVEGATKTQLLLMQSLVGSRIQLKRSIRHIK
jgi:hypothetical protein